ncbi:MAG TPA: SWIM zinc finger family protein [Planctomycetota bacterium]|nr:SWIM zinc finger family protein [Planctomycetota bacterium]
MEFSYSYASSSSVTSGADSSAVSFSPDLKRQPTYFSGKLRLANTFREAVSALHDVVVSDLRFKPKDKSAYKAWLAQHEEQELVAALAKGAQLQAEVTRLDAELRDLDRRFAERAAPFLEAKKRYFNWLYQVNKDFWFVLDPVITVHPDEIFFECFSQDESSYGRLGASYEYFEDVGELACGTTNVDYSSALYDEFQKIRSYKTTTLTVDPTGFGVKTTNEDAYKEVKIDLPDSWVRGFLQVSSAMSLPSLTFELHPMDVHNLCFVLRRHKEKQSPRALRWHLTRGQPVKAVLEPWEIEVPCPRSIYTGSETTEVRTWGRRRILILERLIPIARSFRVHLLGKGMPSFWVADLGGMTFTLGLSGWTANDWSAQGQFDLLAPRKVVDEPTKRRVFEALKKKWFAKPDDLARDLALDRAIVLGALGAWTQAGRAIYDLSKDVYRARELSREPLPMEKLRFASEREANAMEFVVKNAVKITKQAGGQITGTVSGQRRSYPVAITLDADDRIRAADCQCNWHQHNQLFKGPCEHILALRLAHARGSERRSWW